jgi:hypothetical protein
MKFLKNNEIIKEACLCYFPDTNSNGGEKSFRISSQDVQGAFKPFPFKQVCETQKPEKDA